MIGGHWRGSVIKLLLSKNFIVLALRIVTQLLMLGFMAVASRSGSAELIVVALPMGLVTVWGLIDFGYAHGVVNDPAVIKVNYTPYWIIGLIFIILSVALCVARFLSVDEIVIQYGPGFIIAVFLAICTSLGAVFISKSKTGIAAAVQGYQLLVVFSLVVMAKIGGDVLSFVSIGFLSWAGLIIILWLNSSTPSFRLSLGFQGWWHAFLNQGLIIAATQSDIIVLSIVLMPVDLVSYMSITRGVMLLYLFHVTLLGSYRNKLQELLRSEGFLSYRMMSCKYFSIASMFIFSVSIVYFMCIDYLKAPSIAGINNGLWLCGAIVLLYVVKVRLDLWSMVFFIENKLPFISRMAFLQAALTLCILPYAANVFGALGVVASMVLIASVFLMIFRVSALRLFSHPQ